MMMSSKIKTRTQICGFVACLKNIYLFILIIFIHLLQKIYMHAWPKMHVKYIPEIK